MDGRRPSIRWGRYWVFFSFRVDPVEGDLADFAAADLSHLTRVIKRRPQAGRRTGGVPDVSEPSRVTYNALEYAVGLELLPSNPLGKVRRKRGQRPMQEVDRRVVVNPRQARELLTAATYVGGYDRASGRRLRAFYGCLYYLYYTAMRSADALALRRFDCQLPETGWGRITVEQTALGGEVLDRLWGGS
ncbi:hypothetical protein [Streptomyces xinghaiensis]|uniref:hypothetical protein n=1 Tax=Streptomyces xinghaiensis TaxID=1038928 RepID=UPI0034238FED